MTSDLERHASTKLADPVEAPGAPGDPARWSTGAKTGVGTAMSQQSRIWFTISHGILNEIYFPSIDQANTRSLQFVVASANGFLSKEEQDTDQDVKPVGSGIPAFRIVNRCKQGRYEIRKEIVTDPDRDALLIDVRFGASNSGDLSLYVLLDPHLADCGGDNTGWVGQYKGIPMLFALRRQTSLALACSVGFGRMSAGFVGVSDAWTDLKQHGRMSWTYTEANCGNVMLAAEIPDSANGGKFTLALGMGGHPAEAGQQARAALIQDFDRLRNRYVHGWELAQQNFIDLTPTHDSGLDHYRVSTAVLAIHESKRFPGATVAGLSVPWGFARGDDAIGGYHVIWPRDMVHAAIGRLACGDAGTARRTLFYLRCTQESDGNWSQNMWLDGTPHWTSTQMDGTSFVILLADALRRLKELEDHRPWPMIRKAASYLLRFGPVTEQDRWEENAGYSCDTMAVEVAALLAAADFAAEEGHPEMAEFLRLTADAWNDAIDELTYVRGTQMAEQFGVDGYYIRISPPEAIETGLQRDTAIRLKNKPEEQAQRCAVEIVSPDALGLVRFGLRSAHDPRIVSTVRVIDGTLKKEISNGPVWFRYTDDGYGEHPDGRPFDGTGTGHGWPLLAGERAHYEIARGNFEEADRLRKTMERQSSAGGLIPEQVWDLNDIPEHDLFNGSPTGSGMPLVWAHAEYISLLRSLRDRQVWNLPAQTVLRYQNEKRTASFQIWTSKQQRKRISRGKDLRIDVPARARIRWSSNNWESMAEVATADSGLGVHYAVLKTSTLPAGAQVRFTFFWAEKGAWDDHDFVAGVI
jgi:glucoamylase